MTLHESPAPARTDLPPARAAGRPARPYALPGLMLTAGAMSWALAQAAFGINVDHDETWPNLVYSVSGGLFQVGLLALLTVLWRTQALGVGRLARFFLRVEFVLVSLAMCSTAADALELTDMDQVGWILLDANWPLSMLGMFCIGIRIAIAGRWSGPERFWPMVAESWVFVVIPAMGIFGETVGTWVSVVHLCLGYGVLGALVARKA